MTPPEQNIHENKIHPPKRTKPPLLSLDSRVEPVEHDAVKLGLDPLDADLVNDLFSKTVRQQIPRERFGQTARQQVKQLFFLELTDRRTVRAFHVVVEDLELRLCVDTSVVRQKEILIRLLRVCPVRVLANKNFSVEYRTRFVIQHALVILMRCAVQDGVVDDRMRIQVLRPADHVKAVDHRLTTLSCELNIDVMTRE